VSTAAPTSLDGYTLRQRPNQLARRGCFYVTDDATGVLIGWVGLVNGEGDSWSALSFAVKDASEAPDAQPWFWGRVAAEHDWLDADGALERLVVATPPEWIQAQLDRPPLPKASRRAIVDAERRHRDRWFSPYLEDMRRQGR
jgi:hypothetical protein